MPQSHYAPVQSRMVPYVQLECTGGVLGQYLNCTGAVRELYMYGNKILECSKNQAIQIVLEP